mgnify:CR=1 FL=1
MSPTLFGNLRRLLAVTLLSSTTLLTACEPAGTDGLGEGVEVNLPSDADIDEAFASITEEEIRQHVQVLASDEFGGRAPSSPGEVRTIQYMTEQFAALGLEPGGENGSWVQEVPMVAMTADPNMRLSISGPGGSREFQNSSDFVAWTTRVTESVSVDASELVFVGYGAVAPEYGWDDYASVDVTGKTVVILVNPWAA